MAWNNRYPLIMNPSARSDRADKARKFIMDHATDFVIYASESAEDARQLAAHFTAQKEPVIVAAGGDGTINTVVQQLAGSETALGILPTGTMNVFARELGIPSSDFLTAMNIIKEGHAEYVDLFTVNKQPFIQMAGIGFDARIIEETSSESKKALGPLAYGISAAKVLGETPPKMQIKLDGELQTEGVCILIGNGGLYGGQFKLFEKSVNTDGLLDILIFKEAGYQAILDFLKGLYATPNQGSFTHSGSIEYYQSASISVTSDREVPLELDGEYLGRDTEFAFELSPEKLKVLAPKTKVINEWQESLSALAPFMPWK